MEHDVEQVESRVKVATRIRPGDRWQCIFSGASSEIIFDNLTDALEHIFQKLGNTQFIMDSKAGEICIFEYKEQIITPVPLKKYSLYDDF